MSRLFCIAAPLLSLLLASCAPLPASNAYEQSPQADQNSNAQIQLAEAASSVSQSLATLAAIETASNHNIKLPPPLNAASIDMDNYVSVDWTGPMQPLLAQIAASSHYRLNVLGRRPLIPLLVSVHVRNQPLAMVLRDLRYQANQQANLKIYPRRRIIELRYRHG